MMDCAAAGKVSAAKTQAIAIKAARKTTDCAPPRAAVSQVMPVTRALTTSAAANLAIAANKSSFAALLQAARKTTDDAPNAVSIVPMKRRAQTASAAVPLDCVALVKIAVLAVKTNMAHVMTHVVPHVGAAQRQRAAVAELTGSVTTMIRIIVFVANGCLPNFGNCTVCFFLQNKLFSL